MMAAAWMFAMPVTAQQLYKCGATYQDRPCATQDVQQRYSSSTGFSVHQVNPDTDKDCAGAAAKVFTYWERMDKGEPFEKLKAEVDDQPIAKAEKSRMRDLFLILREFRGTPKEVRSQLETQCMNYKRAHGMPTEKQLATSGVAENPGNTTSAAAMRARIAQERAAQARMRAEEQRARMEAERRAAGMKQ